MKICVCIGADWQEQWPQYVSKAELVEFRLDLICPDPTTIVPTTEALKPLLSEYPHHIILTCRTGTFSQKARSDLFFDLLPFSPAYIDLAYDTPRSFCAPLYAAARKCGVKIINSFHDFETTPDRTELCTIAKKALAKGADIVKIVTKCHNPSDEARLLSLYKEPDFTNRLIAFSMGHYGLTSRLHAAALGAPILYVAPDDGMATAPGQPRFTQFKEHLLNLLC